MEYNVQYLNLQREIKLLKLHAETEEMRKKIDSLGKELDDRYFEGRYLDEIEIRIKNIKEEV